MQLPSLLRLRQLLARVGAVVIMVAASMPALAHPFFLRGNSTMLAAKADPVWPKEDVLAAYISSTYGRPFQYSRRIVSVTFDIARTSALPPSLLLAIMAKESFFDATAVSPYGARGLMQVVPRFHLDKLKPHETEDSLHEPTTNVRIAAQILSRYLKDEGDVDRALARYSGNAPGYSTRVQAYWRRLAAVEGLRFRKSISGAAEA